MAKKQSALSSLITAIAYIAIGVLFIIKQDALLKWIMIVAGALFVLQGLYDIIRNKDKGTAKLAGFVKIVIGVALILCGVISGLFIYASIALGAMLILYAILTFFSAPKNVFSVIAFVLTIIVGLVLVAPQLFGFLDPIKSVIYYIIGGILIVNGIILLFGKRK